MTTCSKIDDLRARSTCEQDRCVCVILHISSWRYSHIVTLFWCINDDCNLCVCVILHITSWRYGRIVTLFLCINDDNNLCVCVWFCISRDMLLWLSLCSTSFCMIYLLTCKSWRTSRQGLANPCLFWCNMFVISHILPITKAMLVR
jgi:hypothetical protein